MPCSEGEEELGLHPEVLHVGAGQLFDLLDPIDESLLVDVEPTCAFLP